MYSLFWKFQHALIIFLSRLKCCVMKESFGGMLSCHFPTKSNICNSWTWVLGNLITISVSLFWYFYLVILLFKRGVETKAEYPNTIAWQAELSIGQLFTTWQAKLSIRQSTKYGSGETTWILRCVLFISSITPKMQWTIPKNNHFFP